MYSIRSTRRTRRTRRTAVTAAALALACLLLPAGGGDGPAAPGEGWPPGIPGPVPDPAPHPARAADRDPDRRTPGEDGLNEGGLRAALLDHMDFPAGWASDSRDSAAERGIGVPRPDEAGCRALFESAEDTAARAGFARTETGPFVTTVAASHAGPADARAAVEAFRQKAAGECATFHTREGPESDAVTVSYDAGEPAAMRAELERLGEAAEDGAALRFHRRVEGGSGGTPVIAEVVIVRVGSHTVRVAQAGRDDAGTGSVAEIAARAVEKLAQVCEGRTPAPEPHQPGTTEL